MTEPMKQATCTAQTKSGRSCRSFALPNRDLCVMHAPDMAEKIAAARRRGGTKAAQMRVLQGKKLRLDTPQRLIKFFSDLMDDTLAGTVDPKTSNALTNTGSLQRQLIEA